MELYYVINTNYNTIVVTTQWLNEAIRHAKHLTENYGRFYIIVKVDKFIKFTTE